MNSQYNSPTNAALPSDLIFDAAMHLTKIRVNLKPTESSTTSRIFPNEPPEDTAMLHVLRSVIVGDIVEPRLHCHAVAKTTGRGCNVDISRQSAWEALQQLTTDLSSDPQRLSWKLVQIAEMVVCRREGNRHLLQAANIANNWFRMAKDETRRNTFATSEAIIRRELYDAQMMVNNMSRREAKESQRRARGMEARSFKKEVHSDC
jgi:hypothetical protein